MRTVTNKMNFHISLNNLNDYKMAASTLTDTVGMELVAQSMPNDFDSQSVNTYANKRKQEITTNNPPRRL